jgi:uncharacterized protein
MTEFQGERMRIAIVGTGIAGLSAAWLLAQRHDIVVYEQASRLGGHSNTVDVPAGDVPACDVPGGAGAMPVDMGFIVYNPETYPNLSALFRHLKVPTQASDMSFAVSLRDGETEYAGTDLRGLFTQKRNLVRPRFWSMLRDLLRFYREGARDARAGLADEQSLGEYLAAHGYGAAFIHDHLLPMAAAVWSTPPGGMLDHPAAAFLRFSDNHGLLRLVNRPEWRTVSGGSRAYVERLTVPFARHIRLGCGVRSLTRRPNGVRVIDSTGQEAFYDHVVVAAHADQALRMLTDPSDAEARILGAMAYGRNDAVMHRDPRLMPRRENIWCSWNYIGGGHGQPVCASYWMNRLQGLCDPAPVFVTLNPQRAPVSESIIHRETYEHPRFDAAAMRAQRDMWSLQGVRRTWYCGAYCGAGFHEDGLQAGLAVAEALGGLKRPWRVRDESGRIHLPAAAHQVPVTESRSRATAA